MPSFFNRNDVRITNFQVPTPSERRQNLEAEDDNGDRVRLEWRGGDSYMKVAYQAKGQEPQAARPLDTHEASLLWSSLHKASLYQGLEEDGPHELLAELSYEANLMPLGRMLIDERCRRELGIA